jgi:hypothetical protein
MEGEGEAMKKLEIIQDFTNLSKEWTRQTKCCAITRAAGKLRNVPRNLCSLCYTWFPAQFHTGQKIHHKPKSKV